MRVFGLTGNTGTGKTTVADLLRERGVAVVDADVLARQVVEPGEPALTEIAATFGEDFLDSEGRLRRRALGRLVFSDADALARLGAITHPRIAQRADAEFRRLAQEGAQYVVYDAAILFEAGLDRQCDAVIVVTATREQQIQRIMERDGLSREEVVDRIASQMPLEEKARRADYVVVNQGAIDELGARVDALVTWMEASSVTASGK
jgi:dephospho-CoA kinase